MQNNKKVIHAVLIVIIVIAVATSSYFAWKAEKKSPAEPIIADETANWKTYKNEKYGFEFKYPESWSMDESGKSRAIVIFKNPIADKNQDELFYANLNIIIEPFTNFGVKDIEGFINFEKNMLLKNFPDDKFFQNEIILLDNGKEGHIFNFTLMQNNVLLRDRHLIVFNNDVAYVVAGTVLNSKWDVYESLIESAFSTFKFTK